MADRGTHSSGGDEPDLPVLSGDCDKALVQQASRKAIWRLLAVWSLVVFTTKIDRGNVSFASSALMEKLSLSNTQYGEAAGAFYITYMVFQLPGQWLARRLGIRRCISLLLASWMIITLATAFVQTKWQLTFCRLLLGASEAGTFPIFYMHLSKYLLQSDFNMAWAIGGPGVSGLSSILAGPVAAVFLAMPSTGGLDQWQWLLIGEGIGAGLVGVVVFFCLPDSPETDTAFTEEERAALLKAKAREHSASDSPSHHQRPTGQLQQPERRNFFLNWKAWYLSVLAFAFTMPGSAFSFFAPLMVKHLLGSSAATAAALNTLPYAMEVPMLLLHGQALKRLPRHARLWQALLPIGAAVSFNAAFAVASRSSAQVTALLLLSLTQALVSVPVLNIDTLPSAYAQEIGSASGTYALINTVRSSSVFIASVWFGWLTDRFSDTEALGIMLPVTMVPSAALFVGWFFINGDGPRALGLLGMPCWPSLPLVNEKASNRKPCRSREPVRLSSDEADRDQEARVALVERAPTAIDDSAASRGINKAR